MQSIKYHIEAEIEFVPAELGGRQTPVKTGYRGQFHYSNEKYIAWDAIQDYPSQEWVNPGESVVALMRFASPEKHYKKIQKGMCFQIQEGDKIVANGTIERVFEQLTIDGMKRRTNH